MKNVIASLLLLLLLPIIISQVSSLTINPRTKQYYNNRHLNFIERSCKKTLYPKLCLRSMSAHSPAIKNSPKLLAATALQVTFNKTRSTSKTLEELSRRWGLRPYEKSSLIECVEEVGDSVYELAKSMKKLSHSKRSQANFELKMSDVQTWVSAALTDDGTCMDDFEVSSGEMKALVRKKVWKIARLTSIALSFVNSYAGVYY